MAKINVLVIYTDKLGGVGFYRSTQPHKKLEELYSDEFNVTYETEPNWDNLDDFTMYDIIHIHKGIFNDDEKFVNAMKFFKEKNITTVMDIDDHWKMDYRHPQYLSQKSFKIDEKIKRNFKLFDYVTTTTKLFANEIKPFNKNVVIFPNAIDENDSRFQVKKEKCDKLRVGLIMGSTHEHDLQIMDGFISKLPKDVLDKIEIVLCGFDLRGNIRTINRESGEIKVRQMLPQECVWYRYEKMLTNDYKTVSEDYKAFLNTFKEEEYPNHVEEGYRRCWTKDIDNYYQHYSNVDVLLAPLEKTEFNKVKSQLKVVEAAFSHTAIIASEFGPYTLDLNNIFVKGGSINENGNAILIDEAKNHKDWSKAIEKLVKNPELVTLLQNNLYNSITKNYNLDKVTSDRCEFYKKITNKN